MPDPKLNKVEVWILEHSIRIFLAIAVALVAAGIGVLALLSTQGHLQHDVNVLKPKVTKIVHEAAICNKKALTSPKRTADCAKRIAIAFTICRADPDCRATLLAAIAGPPPPRSTSSPAATSGGGDAFQPSSHGHQPQGPGSQPGPSPSPSPSPAPTGPQGGEQGKPAETPGNGPVSGHGDVSPSGAGVEVCALSSCVGAEVGLPH